MAIIDVKEAPTPAAAPSHELTQGHILKFYAPLALSWIFMAIESPVSLSVISRLANPTINTAAFNLLMGLALWLESPVIDLLSTSTTLAKDRQHYAKLSRFVQILLVWVTVVHALVALTPLYWVVTRDLIGVPQEVAASARLGMIVMIPWSAMIGWRRYLQGILIRYGRTRLVGMGTAVRVSTMTLTAGSMYFFTHLPGIEIAAIALVSAVSAEALFAHLASRRVIAAYLSTVSETTVDLSLKKLFSFHAPLTVTTMVTLCGLPIITAALARSPGDSTLTLASYQIAASFIWLYRTIVFALPEVVITLYKNEQTAAALKRFSIGVGTLTSSALLIVGLSGLDGLFFEKVLGAQHDVATLAHIAFLAACLQPLLGALQSFVRGMLTAHHLTVSRLMAVGVGMTALISALAIGVGMHISGLITASIAMTLALLAELGALGWAWRRGSRRLEAI